MNEGRNDASSATVAAGADPQDYNINRNNYHNAGRGRLTRYLNSTSGVS